MSRGEIHSKCSYLNCYPGRTSYLTDQALRRLRYHHTSIATQNWGPCRIKDTTWTGTDHRLPNAFPKMQAFSPFMSNRPSNFSTASPIKHERNVQCPRGKRVVSAHASREQHVSTSPRTEARTFGYQMGSLVTLGTSATSWCYKNDERNSSWMTVSHNALKRRRGVFPHRNIVQQRCKWTENVDVPCEVGVAGKDKTNNGGTSGTSELHKTLPNIVLPIAHHVEGGTRRRLGVRQVRLKTPPPSPVRHITVHLPSS